MTQIQANGIKIEAESKGDRKHPTLVLIRGLGTQMVQWPPTFLEGLVAAGLRVIIFDNRDVGLSQKFDDAGAPDLAALMAGSPDAKAPYSLGDMSDDVAGVLDAFEVDSAHVFGMSMGGMIAQTFAAQHRDRARSLTSMMSSSGAPGLPAAKPEAMKILMSQPADPSDRTCVIEHGLVARRVLGSPGFPDDDETIREELGLAFDRCHDRVGVQRQMAAVTTGGSRVSQLNVLKIPTLVIHGADDPLIPMEGGKSTAENIPGARLEIIDGMGHDLPRALVPRLLELIVEHVRCADA